jgi:hypothetical protein
MTVLAFKFCAWLMKTYYFNIKRYSKKYYVENKTDYAECLKNGANFLVA